jgi:putative addiction module CopG family antidote
VNVSLTPYWEQYIHNLVQSGEYNSASEVVRDALRYAHGSERRPAPIVNDDQEHTDA